MSASTADAVILTTELPDTYRLLGRTPRRLLPLRPSPSAVVAHVGCRSPERQMPHHHILFGDTWEQTFTEIIDDGVVMSDPSLLVTRPTAGDPTLAPDGRDLLYVLAPAPNLARGTVDWDSIGSAYTDSMMAAVTDRLPQLGVDAELLHVVNPADWANQGMVAGTPFALAHTFAQTGPFRPGQHRSRHRQRRAGRLVDGAGCRGADRAAVGTTGSRPGHRGRHPTRAPRTSEAGRHDPLRTRRRRDATILRCATPIGTADVLNAEHGRTFFLATRLLAPEQRPAVHALYGFARRADDILDDFDATLDAHQRAERLQRLATQLFNQLVQQQDCGDDPTLRGCRAHRAHVRHPAGSCSTTSSRRCGWT